MFPRAPYLKRKGFNPMPVVRGGIPREADSRANPKVWGTPPWESFWRDQIYCILHGYQTGGWFLPGRYYYYLNFNDMSTAEFVRAPDMCDLHLELAYLVEYCQSNGMNAIIPKKRRAGVSEFFHKGVLDYGWRFFPGFIGGVAAGKKTHADEFMTKWRTSEAMLVPELSVKRLKSNDKVIIAGYDTKNELGETVQRGSKNKILVETMFQDANLFKGKYLVSTIFEEAGEFSKLIDCYDATRAGLMIGERQAGSMYFFGTAGRMDRESEGLKKIWDQHDFYNAIRFDIPGPRFHIPYYGGATDSQGNLIEKVPNLLKEFKPYEIIGVEDLEASKQTLLAERARLLKYGRSESYQKYIQEYPMNVGELFTKTTLSAFDVEALSDQSMEIFNSPSKKYFKCQLDWVKDDKGLAVTPLQVIARLDNETTEEVGGGEYFLIHESQYPVPLKGYANLFAGGGDAYDQIKAKTSKSKGGMCVIIRRNAIGGQMNMAPVATILCRPNDNRKFYEMCLKLCVYFDLRQSFLVDVANKFIIEYFKDRGCAHYLAYRPRKFESEESQQSHEYGFHLNKHSKPLMVDLMAANITDYGKNNWFPDLIRELQNYDAVTIESDNDLADAYGIALVQDASEEVQARSIKEYTDPNMFHTPVWYTDSNGNKRMRNGSSVNGDLLPKEDFKQGRFGEY